MTPTETLARTAWGEARGEGTAGMQCVCNVVMQRVKQSGRDVISVCLAPYQFSCWLDADPNCHKLLAVTDDDPEYRIACNLAADAIEGQLPDLTHGADHYFAVGSAIPSWARGVTPTITIGHHQFYRLGWPRPLSVVTPKRAFALENPATTVVNSPINSATTQGTAGLSMGVSGAIVVLVAGVLQHYGVIMTPEQTAALGTLLAVALHPISVLLIGNSETAQALPVATAPVTPKEPPA